MTNVTHILSAIEQGDPHAAAQHLPLVYDELRRLDAQKLAREKPGQTFQAMALVDEPDLWLVEVKRAQRWNGRERFFAAAAEAMRRTLRERAGEKQRCMRGGKPKWVDFRQAEAVTSSRSDASCSLMNHAFFARSVTNAARAPIKVVW
jgi:hypothetical protein